MEGSALRTRLAGTRVGSRFTAETGRGLAFSFFLSPCLAAFTRRSPGFGRPCSTVCENSSFRTEAERNFWIRVLTVGWSRISWTYGRSYGFFWSIFPMRSRRPREYCELTGGYTPRTILWHSICRLLASNGCLSVVIS